MGWRASLLNTGSVSLTVISHALWRQRQYQGPGRAERVARYLSKYVSKERAADWLRERVGQRVFCSSLAD
jgi:hypothetical protein